MYRKSVNAPNFKELNTAEMLWESLQKSKRLSLGSEILEVRNFANLDQLIVKLVDAFNHGKIELFAVPLNYELAQFQDRNPAYEISSNEIYLLNRDENRTRELEKSAPQSNKAKFLFFDVGQYAKFGEFDNEQTDLAKFIEANLDAFNDVYDASDFLLDSFEKLIEIEGHELDTEKQKLTQKTKLVDFDSGLLELRAKYVLLDGLSAEELNNAHKFARDNAHKLDEFYNTLRNQSYMLLVAKSDVKQTKKSNLPKSYESLTVLKFLEWERKSNPDIERFFQRSSQLENAITQWNQISDSLSEENLLLKKS